MHRALIIATTKDKEEEVFFTDVYFFSKFIRDVKATICVAQFGSNKIEFLNYEEEYSQFCLNV